MLRLALALLLLLTVPACSGGAEPAALSAELAAPAPAESSLPPEPESLETTESAVDPVEAAVREYVAAANVAMSTGDTDRFRQVVTPECTCLAFADTVAEAFADGSRIEGLAWSIREIRVGRADTAEAAVILEVDSSGHRVWADAQYQEVPAKVVSSYVRLVARDGWLVADVDILNA